MNGKRMVLTVVAIILTVATLAGTVGNGVGQGLEGAGRMGHGRQDEFVTTLRGNVPARFVLGPSVRAGGYVVDITPLSKSNDGAYIEKQVLPEYDGEQWVDVLTLLLPMEVHPVTVRVQVYSTAGWPRVFESTLSLIPGEWMGYMVVESVSVGGYVIEINPQGVGAPGDTVEKAIMQPEYPFGAWWDVLRIQIPVEQAAMEAEVIIYQTPSDLPVVLEYELVAEPGAWIGLGVGLSRDGGAYVVEMTPTTDDDPSWLYRYTLQPEFDGENWNDVVRLMVHPDFPPMPLRVTVYQVGGN